MNSKSSCNRSYPEKVTTRTGFTPGAARAEAGASATCVGAATFWAEAAVTISATRHRADNIFFLTAAISFQRAARVESDRITAFKAARANAWPERPVFWPDVQTNAPRAPV